MIIASSQIERAKRLLMEWVDEDKPEDTYRSWDIVLSSYEDVLSNKFPVRVTVRLESLVGYGDQQQKLATMQLVPVRHIDVVVGPMVQEINQKEWEVRDEMEGQR